jgi:1-acyl-sn-glycerol-3-phosphate acyltransferase
MSQATLASGCVADRVFELPGAWGGVSALAGRLARGAFWKALRCWLGLYHRIEIHGREHLPDSAPCVLVANHASHLDTLALATALTPRLRERLRPLAAADVFFCSSRRARLMRALLHALPLARRHCGLHHLQALRHRLEEEGCVYILYPEGTRSRTGAMGAFKDGLGLLTAGSRVPVVPCYLHGTFDALPAGKWLPRPRRISLHIGPPLSFASVANTRAGWAYLTARVEAAIRRLGRRMPPAPEGVLNFSRISSEPWKEQAHADCRTGNGF